MGLRDAARDAYISAHEATEQAARAVLADVLVSFDVDELTTVDVAVAETWTRFVVADGEGVHLAVSRRHDDEAKWTVSLVVDDGGWAEVAEVTSLAQLHEVLPPADEEGGYPQWVQRHSPDGYEMGDRVIYDGQIWEVVQVGGDGGNQWRPGEFGWQLIGDA